MIEPTGYTALDVIGFTDKGAYSSAANYVINDLVHYSASIWRCKVDDTTGVTPAEGATWTIFISDAGALAEVIIAPIELSPIENAHAVGDQIIWNDTLYKVIAPISIGDSLTVGINIAAAKKIVVQISDTEKAIASVEPLSTSSRAYAIGDYLYNDGKLYRVKAAIAQNDAFVVNTNIEIAVIGDILTQIKSDITGIEGDIDTVNSNLAPAENGSTASTNYAVGEHLTRNKVLYRARTAITAGDSFTVGTNIEAVKVGDEITQVKSDITGIEGKIDTVNGNLAPAEDGSTASANYAIGEHLTRNDVLYKAKTAITAGDSFTVGTNIEPAKVGTEISQLNSAITKTYFKYFDVNLKNTVVTGVDGGGYYGAVNIQSLLPSGYMPVYIAVLGAYTGGISFTLQCSQNNSQWNITIASSKSYTFPNDDTRIIRVFCVPYEIIS